MIHFKKSIQFMILLVACFSHITYSHEEYKNNRTELMEYVIEKEAEIKIKKAIVDKLWDTYFYNQSIATGTVHVKDNVYITHQTIALRRIYTTDADVAEYRIVEDEFNMLIENTIEHIKYMVLQGADLHAQDVLGKTVIDYCRTKKIYETLVKCGAPTTWEKWCSFNTEAAVVVGFAGIVTLTIAGFITACTVKILLGT